jgi:hypothetical protein
MAPRIQDTDEDYLFDHKQTIFDPLHESCHAINSIRTRDTTSTPRTRRVSFGAMATTHEIMSICDYTPQELEASWYDIEIMHAMKETARSDAKLVDAGLLSEGRDVSIRGLEHRTRHRIQRKRQSRRNAYMAVFFEIDLQIEEDYCNNNKDDDDYYYHYFDAESIADAYFEHSEPCAADAHMIGMQDELNARKIYDEHDPQ